MRIFIVRHGQVLPTGQSGCAFDTSRDDPTLTPLGEKQALLAGEELCRCGFQGKIISSPFSRTLNTAAHISRACGLSFSIDPRFREIVDREEGLRDFKGKTLAEMKQLYPEIDQETLPYPWWTAERQTMADVLQRVRPLILECMAQEEDCVLVGHGASTQAAVAILLEYAEKAPDESVHKGDNVNCAISEFVVEKGAVTPIRIQDCAHLPDDCITSNQRPVIERDGKKCIVM